MVALLRLLASFVAAKWYSKAAEGVTEAQPVAWFISDSSAISARTRTRESDVIYVIDVVDAWLSLPAVGLFAVLIIVFAFSGILWSWLSFWSPLSPRVRTLTGVVGPYFASVGFLFSLLAAFLANEIANQERMAWQAGESHMT